MLGPHIAGEEDCRPNGPSVYCENTGNLLGLGVNLELRGRLAGPLYAQLRGALVGNVRGDESVYSGLAMPGAGLGLYGRRVFLRAEYLAVLPFGVNRYRSPFASQPDSRVDIGNHAGLFSVGARFYVRHPFGDAEAGISRLMCSFDTTPEEVDGLLADVERAMTTA